MKLFAAAYQVQQGKHAKVKVFRTRAEDMDIAFDNFLFFITEQCQLHVLKAFLCTK